LPKTNAKKFSTEIRVTYGSENKWLEIIDKGVGFGCLGKIKTLRFITTRRMIDLEILLRLTLE
jgi:hypothetical protein